MERQNIDDLIKKIINKFNFKYPINLDDYEKLIKYYNGKIIFDDSLDNRHGFLIFNKDESFEIVLPYDTQVENIKRLSRWIACLNIIYNINEYDDYRKKIKTIIPSVNLLNNEDIIYFSVSLIIPTNVFQRVLDNGLEKEFKKKRGDAFIPQIIYYFNTDITIVGKKLYYLGYNKNN